MKDYGLDKFNRYMRENYGIMPVEIIERVVEIGNGIMYLYK